MNLNTPIEALPRVGAAMGKKLRTLGISCLEDLLYYFPFRYDDFSVTTPIAELKPGFVANVVGTIEMIAAKRTTNRRMSITEAIVADASGMAKVIWFNQPFIATNLAAGDSISLSGRIDEDFTGPYFVSPTYEKLSISGGMHTMGLVPNYHLTAGITQKQLRSFIGTALKLVGTVDDWQLEDIKKNHKLLNLFTAIKELHFPSSPENLSQARHRLAFDELFLLQLESQLVKQGLADFQAPQIVFKEDATRNFVASLGFDLTPAQKLVAWEILQDIGQSKPMMRLVEGDVGSGKTLVAMIPMLNTALNLRQAVLMAPTEILAKQHYATFCRLLKEYDIKVGLAVSSERRLSNREISKKLTVTEVASEADIIIGTHALIQDKVYFRDLALVAIDEQHRFGVEQRQKLIEKAREANSEITPHLLSMTATPIPRSLALALYDELDLSLIKQMPKGRQVIKTKIFREVERLQAYDLVRQQIKQGRQAFVVCPLIEESDRLGAKSAKAEYDRLQKQVFGDCRIGLLHGKLTPKAKEAVMTQFSQGDLDILVSTAVVEVGVDVPNATVMLIESSDRFGLAQLHQYRGRVGRGQHQSYCFLMAEDVSKKSLERLECMVAHSSGFDLAEADLRFRGPGEVFGVLQKGFPELKIASLFDIDLMKEAKDAVIGILASKNTDLAIFKEKIKKNDIVHME